MNTAQDVLKKAKRFITDQHYRTIILGNAGILKWLDDERYLKLRYKATFGKELDLDDPQTFNEKIQWLKLHDRNPEYTKMVDKYEVKKYVADKIGEKYIIPTYGAWDSFDEIDFDALPDSFVLKCTHDCGGVVICPDKNSLDISAARKKLNRRLKRNYYWPGREWPYKNVKPRIIAEKYMVDESGYELKDYKVFNFNGEPKIIVVDFDRFTDHKHNLYDTSWRLIDGEINYKSDPKRKIAKPACLDEMLKISETLSQGIPFVRTDLYCIDDKVYFGEMTFYHGSGFSEFRPESLGLEFGSWLTLPEDSSVHNEKGK